MNSLSLFLSDSLSLEFFASLFYLEREGERLVACTFDINVDVDDDAAAVAATANDGEKNDAT